MTYKLLAQGIIASIFAGLLSACMHDGPSMVRGQLKTYKSQSAPILQQIESYKITNGFYPLNLADLEMNDKYRIPVNTKYERYLAPSKSNPNEDAYRYRLNTSWRIHAGSCSFDSEEKKWRCDTYPNKAYNLEPQTS